MKKTFNLHLRDAYPGENREVAELILRANPHLAKRIARFVARGARWHDVTPVVGEIDGKLATCACVYHRAVRVGAETARFGGIGAVATLPEYRGRGLASKALERCEEVMRERGYAVAILFCSIVEFYKRLGWSVMAEEMADFRLPAAVECRQSSTRTSRVRVEEIPAELRCVADATSAVVRTDGLWREYLDWRREDDDLCFGAFDGICMVAYCRARRVSQFPESIRIVDTACLPGCEPALILLLNREACADATSAPNPLHAFVDRNHPLPEALARAGGEVAWRATPPDSGIMMAKPLGDSVGGRGRVLRWQELQGGLPWSPRTWWGIDRF